MAKKIFKGAKKVGAALLGINSKSSAKPAATAAPTDPVTGKPIITPLASLPSNSALRKQLSKLGKGGLTSTVLGVGGTLGG